MNKKEFLNALYMVSMSQYGEKFLLELFQRLGIGRPLGMNMREHVLYNFGQELLADLVESSPEIAANILHSLYEVKLKPIKA